MMKQTEERTDGCRNAAECADDAGHGAGRDLVLMLVAKITSMVHVEADDARAPIDSMEASVVGKRTLVTQEDGAPKTIYYMTFQKVNGMRMELEVPGEDYGLAAEGDQGVLVARGEEFIVFKRMI